MPEFSNFECPLYKSQDPRCCLVEQEAKVKKLTDRTFQVGLIRPSRIINLPMYQATDPYIDRRVRVISPVMEHPILEETLKNPKLGAVGRRKIYSIHPTVVHTNFKENCPIRSI